MAVATLTTLIAAADIFTGLQRPLLFMALALWLGAGVLYSFITTLIFYRYTFVHMTPEDLTPPYWIDMGAVAISTLAGATLAEYAVLSPVTSELIPFVKGFTLLFWAIATWWIPMLVVLGLWRYLINGLPIAYDALDWGGVFPLGMYSVATFGLMEILQVPFLAGLSMTFTVIALAAWFLTLLGLVVSRFAPRPSPS